MKPEKASKAPEKCRNRSEYHENEEMVQGANSCKRGVSMSVAK